MAEFEASNFKINIPVGCADLSTYVFGIPTTAQFQPSVVVKFERRQGTPVLRQYCSQQLHAIRSELSNFELLSERPGKHRQYDSVTVVFEWGPPEGPKIRQRQFYVSVPEKSTIFNITATNLAVDFDQTESLFHAILGSFIPK